jgi:CheY-like chemotaxis protein
VTAQDPATAATTGLRILAVDDEPPLLRVIARALRDLDAAVDLADGGAKAIELLSQHDYAVALVDYGMPGMDGIELCEHIRRFSRETISILVTGRTEMEVALSAIHRARIFRFLTKPWSRDDLVATVTLACEQHRLIREHGELSRLLVQRNLELAQLKRRIGAEAEQRAAELVLGLTRRMAPARSRLRRRPPGPRPR